jgi:hypothetical protein
MHDAAHALAIVTRGRDYRVTSLEIFPEDGAGLCSRLTRRGLFDPANEILIRLAGYAVEGACPESESDVVEARASPASSRNDIRRALGRRHGLWPSVVGN